MTKRLISFLIALCLLIAIPLSARYKYNPFTRKLDYYEPVSGSDLGDLGDVTLTGLATGNVLYYNGTAWVNLATGANTNVLTLAAGIPSWAAPGAPAAHAASHEVGGGDLVDHDQLTNYLAAQHLTLPNTIVAVLTDHDLAAHTALGIQHPANVFYVSATGGDYATIQAALTAQNAGGETFLVGPGTYAGDTIHFSASDQVVKPLGHVPNVIVTQADANIVDVGAWTGCMVQNIGIRLTAPTTAINAIQAGTGSLIVMECRVYLATAVALVAADQPSLVGFTGAGTIRIKRGNYQYYHTGNTGGGGVKAAFRANVNLAELHLHKLDVIIITNSGTALATSMYVTTGTAVTEMHNVIDATITDPDATLVIGLGYVGGAGAHNVQGNHVDVVATNNTSYGLYHNGTATIRSAFNAIHASDVAGTSYAFYVGATATLISHFDDLRSGDGNNITGTFTQASSPTDGDFIATNAFVYDRVTEHTLRVGYLAGEDLAAGGEMNVLVGEEAGANITTGDYNTAVGYQSAQFYLTGSYNTTVGYQAGAGVATNNYGDNTFIGAQAGFATTTGSYNVAVGSYTLISITTPSYNTVVGAGAASTLIDGGDNIVIGAAAGAVGTTYDYDIFIGNDAGYSATTAQENVVVGHNASRFNQTGGENVIVGYYAGYGVITKSHSQNVIIGHGAATTIETGGTNVIIGFQAAEDITDGASNIVIGYMAGEGWLDTENEKLVIDVTDTVTPLIYGDFSADNITINGDFNVTMDAALDQLLITQTAVAGTENQPLIFIDDDRTGVTVDEVGEATIVLNAAGTYAMYFEDGGLYMAAAAVFESASDVKTTNKFWAMDNAWITWGALTDWQSNWDNNAGGDDILIFQKQNTGAGDTTAILWSNLNPSGMTDHDGYLSPTFILANDEAADANDYAGVVIGERTQASVLVAHYFDFYAMTGAVDGSVDPNAAELAAIFRFGASGSATPDYATTGGDVLLEGELEVDGDIQFAAYKRDDFVKWNDCFDHGSTVAKYAQDWNVAALNIQGGGSNDIDTLPSHITLTTDNNAVGDNEGTRLEEATILRARRNRSEIAVDLGQTVNTQFYWGWNTSGTNAMVAAADEYVIVFFDVSDNANWQIKVGDGATEDVFTSAIAADTNFVTHEIWVETDGTVHWAVNGTELDITGSVDNLMDASAHYLIVGQAQSVTGAAVIVAQICHIENEKSKM